MNIKRAIGIGVVMYLVSMAVGLAVAGLLKVMATDVRQAPALLWGIGIFLGVVLAASRARWYFRSATTLARAGNGFFYGLVTVLLGFALDLTTVVASSRSLTNFIGDYYGQPQFWLTVLSVLATTTSTGLFLQRRRQA
jgi:hypothetical protein